MNSIRGGRCSLGVVVVLGALGVVAAGCERGGEPAAEVAVDTVGSTVIVTNPAEDQPRPSGADGDSLRAHNTADTIRARQIASIGVEDGASELMFGTISSIAVDGAGRLYVSDAMAEDVRVYSPEGRFIEMIGRGGAGPGEFRRPTGLAFDGKGDLYVRDETRIQRFRREAGGSALRYAGSYPGPAYAYSLASSRIDGDGRLYYPRRAGRIPEQKHFYLVLDTAGAVVDTLALPASVRMPPESAIYRTGRSGGRMIQGLSRAPFAPVPSWDVTPDGHLLVTHGAEYEIVEINSSGDTVRVIRRLSTPRPVPSRELRDSTRAVSRRVAELPLRSSSWRELPRRSGPGGCRAPSRRSAVCTWAPTDGSGRRGGHPRADRPQSTMCSAERVFTRPPSSSLPVSPSCRTPCSQGDAPTV